MVTGVWRHLTTKFPVLRVDKNPYENEQVYREWFRRATDSADHSYSQRSAMKRRLRRITGKKARDIFFEAEWYNLTKLNDELLDNPAHYKMALEVVLDTTGKYSRAQREWANAELSDAMEYNVWEESQPWVDYK